MTQNSYEDIPAQLIGNDGKVVSVGSAFVPNHPTITFYPGDTVKIEEAVMLTATSLALDGQAKRMTVTKGRLCPCSGRFHYHFEKAV